MSLTRDVRMVEVLEAVVTSIEQLVGHWNYALLSCGTFFNRPSNHLVNSAWDIALTRKTPVKNSHYQYNTWRIITSMLLHRTAFTCWIQVCKLRYCLCGEYEAWDNKPFCKRVQKRIKKTMRIRRIKTSDMAVSLNHGTVCRMDVMLFWVNGCGYWC